MEDVRDGREGDPIPIAMWIIAVLAIAPFPASALAYCYGPPQLGAAAMSLLLDWSAVALAFLGGVRWGLETREPAPRAMRQAFSALCAVAAVVVLLARDQAPTPWILGGFIAAFLIQWLFDHQSPDAPSRYPLLSTTLTGAACVSLALALEKSING